MSMPDRGEQTCAPGTPSVLFVGKSSNFSPRLIAATGQDLDDVQLSVVPDPDFLTDFAATQDRAPNLVVMDEQTLGSLTDGQLEQLNALHWTALALAYNSIGYAATSYRTVLAPRNGSVFALNMRLDLWVTILRLILHGGVYVCPHVVHHAPPPVPDGDDGARLDITLTPRQREVMKLVSEGRCNKEIAATLGLSEHTVKLHLHNANRRLGASNRTEAAMRFRSIR